MHVIPGSRSAAILVLSPLAHGRLLGRQFYEQEGSPPGAQWVPDVEVGHRGPISLDDITEAIEMTLLEDTSNEIVMAMRRHMQE